MPLSGAVRQRGLELVKDDVADGEKAQAIRARQRAIGRELRRMYDGVAQEPVPQEFFDLLRQIDDTAAASGKKDW